MLRCICVRNLEIVTPIGGELWPGQAQNGVNLTLECNMTLKVTINCPNRDLNQGFLHLWSKFDDPSLNG